VRFTKQARLSDCSANSKRISDLLVGVHHDSERGAHGV